MSSLVNIMLINKVLEYIPLYKRCSLIRQIRNKTLQYHLYRLFQLDYVYELPSIKVLTNLSSLFEKNINVTSFIIFIDRILILQTFNKERSIISLLTYSIKNDVIIKDYNYSYSRNSFNENCQIKLIDNTNLFIYSYYNNCFTRIMSVDSNGMINLVYDIESKSSFSKFVFFRDALLLSENQDEYKILLTLNEQSLLIVSVKKLKSNIISERIINSSKSTQLSLLTSYNSSTIIAASFFELFSFSTLLLEEATYTPNLNKIFFNNKESKALIKQIRGFKGFLILFDSELIITLYDLEKSAFPINYLILGQSYLKYSSTFLFFNKCLYVVDNAKNNIDKRVSKVSLKSITSTEDCDFIFN